MAWHDDLNAGLGLQPQGFRPGSIESLNAFQQSQVKQPTQPQKKKKDFWTDQISTGGGIGGALAGAAGGAAIGSIVPGIGTVIGGLIGGALGGAGGSAVGQVAENAVSGDNLGQDVAQEALLGGIFSAPPLRALRGVAGAAKGLASGAAKQGFEQGFIGGAKNLAEGGTRSLVDRTSQNLLGGAWGIKSGAKLGGDILTPQRANQLQKFTQATIGVPKNSNADVVLERAVNFREETGKALEQAYKSAKLSTKDISNLSKNFSEKLSRTIGVNTENPIAKDVLGQISSAKTPSELWAIKKELDSSLISWNRNPQSIVPGGEQIAKAARASINETLEKVAPSVKGLNSRYRDTADIIELAAGAARSPQGVPLPGVLRTVGGSPTQSVKALGANVMQGAGRMIGGGQLPKNSIGGFGQNTLRQGVGRAVLGQDQGVTPLEDTLMQNSQPDMLGATQGLQAPYTDQSTQNPYPIENLKYDLQRDPANAEAYIKQYQALQEVYAPATSQLTSSQATRAAAAQNALQDIPLIEEAISSGKLGIAKGIPGAGTPIGRSLLGTENLDAALFNIADNILRARSGAAAPEAEVARFVQTFLPGPFDSEQAKKQKLDRAVRELQGYVNPQAASTGNLEDTLLQLQGGL